ncbi:MAG: 30S ribosomal protein S3 [Candidatus Magasanikbacteria bacterium]
MSHNVHPESYRKQVIYTWDSKWFNDDNYDEFAKDDIRIRKHIRDEYEDSHIDSISIERDPESMDITILAAKPGFIIGRGGEEIDKLRKHIETKILNEDLDVKINVKEIRSPALSASVIAETLKKKIEGRVPTRRAMKKALDRITSAGAQGAKIEISGRLGGSEIARTEKLSEGKVPLITLRADIDYAFAEANTTYGTIGIKVWIYKGEVFGRKDKFEQDN